MAGAFPAHRPAATLRATVALTPFDIAPATGPLPAAVVAFLAAAQAQIDSYFAEAGHRSGHGFIPSDHELVYRTLRTLLQQHRGVRRFCEWGSGFGVVTGLAALLGCEVHGIELDPQLVAASRVLLADHGLDAEIVQGSLIPEDYARSEQLSDLETRTVLSAADAYGSMELAIDDFELIFAYPWPTEEEQYCDLFDRYADYDAVLLTFSRTEGMRAYRKVGKTQR